LSCRDFAVNRQSKGFFLNCPEAITNEILGSIGNENLNFSIIRSAKADEILGAIGNCCPFPCSIFWAIADEILGPIGNCKMRGCLPVCAKAGEVLGSVGNDVLLSFMYVIVGEILRPAGNPKTKSVCSVTLQPTGFQGQSAITSCQKAPALRLLPMRF